MDTDPQALTVSQIKTLLSEAGVELPTTKQPRQFYVDLFLDHQKSQQKTPKKRKSRHSLNVFQSGSKKSPLDEEEKEPIKKRKSLAPGDMQRQQQSPPQAQSSQNQPLQAQSHHLQPQPQVSPPQHQHQPQDAPVQYTQPQSQPLQLPLRGIQPLPQPIPYLPQAQPSSQPVREPQRQSHKHQLPSTLFKSLPQSQNPSHSSTANKQSNYIAPQYLPNYRQVPQQPNALTQQTATPQTSGRSAVLSPSQYPLPPPPSPLPVRAQPLSPLPPPPPPLSRSKERSPLQHVQHSHSKREVNDLLHYLYTILVLLFWIAALVGLYTLVAQYYASSFQFCDAADTDFGSCTRCPEHGICEGGVLRCAPKYVRSGMKCVDDIELSLLAESMAERMYAMLMDAGGQHQCDHSSKYYLSVDELRESLANSGLYPPEKFESAFSEGFDILLDPARYDVGVEGGNKLHSKTVSLSLLCMAKLAFYGQLPYLAFIISIIILGFLVRYWSIQKQRESVEVSNIAATVLLDLQTRKENANGGDAGVVVEHLRDTHLQGMREKRKAALWARVQAVVQADSRVTEYASWRNGAQVTSWEWVS